MANSPDHNRIPELGAVILVGGRSSRMGRDKSSLPFGKTTFLEQIAEQISTVAAPLVVAGKHDQNVSRIIDDLSAKLPDVEFISVNDRYPDCGPLDGVSAGLKELQKTSQFGFVSSCDVPLIKPEMIRMLFNELGSSDAVIPFDDQGRCYGMSAVYRTDIWPSLDELIEKRMLRVSRLAEHLKAKQVPVATIRLIDPELESLMNVNRAEDYEALIRKHFGA